MPSETNKYPSDLVDALARLTSTKVALSLDPSLYTSKTVTKAIGAVNKSTKLIRSHLIATYGDPT